MNYMLRKLLIGASCLVFLFGMAGVADASVVKFTIDSPSYWVDKVAYQMDAVPYIKDGRTYIPIRYVASVCGVKAENIHYEAPTGMVTLIKDDKTEIALKFGVNQIFINGVSSPTDAVPELKNDRIYVPVRYIALAFQRKLYWEESTQSVVIDIGDYLPQAIEELQNGSYWSASEKCTKFLEISPNDSGARLIKGIAQFKLGDIQGAIDSFDNAIALDSANDLAYLSRAEARWALYIKDKQEKALTDSQSMEKLNIILEDVNKSVEISPEPMLLYCRRAGLYNYMGEYAKAIADCNKAIELNPDYRLSYYRRATAIYLKNGQGSFEDELANIQTKFPDDEWTTNCLNILKDKKKFIFDLTDW